MLNQRVYLEKQMLSDSDINKVRQAALRAEEAAIRLESHTSAHQVSLGGLKSSHFKASLRNAPLTPEDSCEESFVSSTGETAAVLKDHLDFTLGELRCVKAHKEKRTNFLTGSQISGRTAFAPSNSRNKYKIADQNFSERARELVERSVESKPEDDPGSEEQDRTEDNFAELLQIKEEGMNNNRGPLLAPATPSSEARDSKSPTLLHDSIYTVRDRHGRNGSTISGLSPNLGVAIPRDLDLEHETLASVLKNEIHSMINQRTKSLKITLSGEDLRIISATCLSKLKISKIQASMRKRQQKLTQYRKQNISSLIRQLVKERVQDRQKLERPLNSRDTNDMSLLDPEQESLLTSARVHNDISLLGPGQEANSTPGHVNSGKLSVPRRWSGLGGKESEKHFTTSKTFKGHVIPAQSPKTFLDEELNEQYHTLQGQVEFLARKETLKTVSNRSSNVNLGLTSIHHNGIAGLLQTPESHVTTLQRSNTKSTEVQPSSLESVLVFPGQPDPDINMKKRRGRRAGTKNQQITPPIAQPTTKTFQELDHFYSISSRPASLDSLLRHREMGNFNSTRFGSNVKAIRGQFKAQFYEDFVCWRGWTGASKDVITAVWAPDGLSYGLGSSTELDNLNIQYNRGNNLLLGDLATNTLRELPDHHVARPKPTEVEYGPNALEDTYNAVDPELYTTVTHICFSKNNDRMYTASYDNTVKVWDISQKGQPECIESLKHGGTVDLMANSDHHEFLATGQGTARDSIRVYSLGSRTTLMTTLSSERGVKYDLRPTCLEWGKSPNTQYLLLAGFAENKHDEGSKAFEGDICLWDISTGSGKSFKLQPFAQSVFDICWHPSLPCFAVATTPGLRSTLTNRSTRSVIRTFLPLKSPSRIIEFECPAADINDVRFHPYDTNYVSAGCTNGSTYIWDIRQPERVLHKLDHETPIDELDVSRSREEQDTGVRFTAWSHNGSTLYTGSSDGVLKAWNVFGNPENDFVCNVARFESGIMSGAFSADKTNLVIGLAQGAVRILSSAPWTHPDNPSESTYHELRPISKAYESIKHIPAKSTVEDELPTAVEISRELLASGRLELHPTYGVGQGPHYDGPYAKYAHPEGGDPSTTPLLPNIRAGQLDNLERRLGRKAGGRATRGEIETYRAQENLARARNLLWAQDIRDERVREQRRRDDKQVIKEEDESDEDDTFPLGRSTKRAKMLERGVSEINLDDIEDEEPQVKMEDMAEREMAALPKGRTAAPVSHGPRDIITISDDEDETEVIVISDDDDDD